MPEDIHEIFMCKLSRGEVRAWWSDKMYSVHGLVLQIKDVTEHF